MKLLFDIDDTLTKTTEPWNELSKVYLGKKGYELIKPDFSERDIEDNYEMTRQQKSLYLRWMWEHFNFRNLEPADGLVETLAELVNLGHTIDFVTARVETTWRQTSGWLKEYLGDILSDKYSINYRRDLPALSSFDVLIDDNIRRINLAREAGKHVVLVDPTGFYAKTDVPTIKSLPELLTLKKGE